MIRAAMAGADSPGTELDRRFMRDALALGARHLGRTWPNPSVGAIVVRETPNGPMVVGRGVTAEGGRPHAETIAIARAGEAARGATIYVTLEPCSHHGKTPPCADAIVSAGVARVVTALEDPDPRVAGQGHARLRAAGIAVETGVLADEARRAHRGHILRVTQGRPAVVLKLAMTADGFAARRSGPRLMITGEAANARVHMMRAHADAIMVGAGTVLADDPQLTVRLPGLAGASPLRIVLDTHARVPVEARIFTPHGRFPTYVVTGQEIEKFNQYQNIEVIISSEKSGGGLDPHAILRELAARGITRVFCEGGPTLAEGLAKAGLIDELVLISSPIALGGDGIPALGPHIQALIGATGSLCLARREQAGADTIATYERAL